MGYNKQTIKLKDDDKTPNSAVALMKYENLNFKKIGCFYSMSLENNSGIVVGYRLVWGQLKLPRIVIITHIQTCHGH